MSINKISLFILSCEKFSDLWDGHVELLERNWKDRAIDTYIVSDQNHVINYENIRLIAPDLNMAWTRRLKYALEKIDTEYVFITLDDYFLVSKVDSKRICDLISLMDDCLLDYIRLFPRPERATMDEISPFSKVHRVDLKCEYSVNLYAGIWRKDFLLYTLSDELDVWHYEVSLSDRAVLYGAQCAVSVNEDFKILDVVRKGKILNKAAAYFRKNGVYHGTRETCSRWYEIRLFWQTLASDYLPKPLKEIIKKALGLLGLYFYSSHK